MEESRQARIHYSCCVCKHVAQILLYQQIIYLMILFSIMTGENDPIIIAKASQLCRLVLHQSIFYFEWRLKKCCLLQADKNVNYIERYIQWTCITVSPSAWQLPECLCATMMRAPCRSPTLPFLEFRRRGRWHTWRLGETKAGAVMRAFFTQKMFLEQMWSKDKIFLIFVSSSTKQMKANVTKHANTCNKFPDKRWCRFQKQHPQNGRLRYVPTFPLQISKKHDKRILEDWNPYPRTSWRSTKLSKSSFSNYVYLFICFSLEYFVPFENKRYHGGMHTRKKIMGILRRG